MKFVAKVTKTDGQMRVTIPKMLVKMVKFEKTEYVIMEKTKAKTVTMRSFINGKAGKR